MVEHFFLQFGAGAAGDALGAEVGLYLGGGEVLMVASRQDRKRNRRMFLQHAPILSKMPWTGNVESYVVDGRKRP